MIYTVVMLAGFIASGIYCSVIRCKSKKHMQFCKEKFGTDCTYCDYFFPLHTVGCCHKGMNEFCFVDREELKKQLDRFDDP